ncbi:hypothetical protein Lser_V15G21058 [Lactuca serriola]
MNPIFFNDGNFARLAVKNNTRKMGETKNKFRVLMGKAKAGLDFTYSGGFPRLKQSFISSDPISESQDLFKDMISSASFARGGLCTTPLCRMKQ